MTDREDEVTTPTTPTALETSRAHKEQTEEARCKPPPVALQRQYVDVLPPQKQQLKNLQDYKEWTAEELSLDPDVLGVGGKEKCAEAAL